MTNFHFLKTDEMPHWIRVKDLFTELTTFHKAKDYVKELRLKVG